MKRYGIIVCLVLAAALLSGCGSSAKALEPMPPVSATAAPPSPTPEPTREPTPEPTREPTPIPEEDAESPSPEAENTAEPTPAGPTATPVAAGKYTYKAKNGTWTLQLRKDGLFLLTGPDGVQHAGESWVTEPDGTVTCGPTDIWEEEFSFDEGCSRWTVKGKTCQPVIG